MRRFLSWCFLVVAYVLVALVATLAFYLLLWIFAQLGLLSPILRWAIIIMGSSIFLGIFLWPLFYGSAFTVSVCEKIKPTKHGVRYIVIAVIMILSLGIDIVLNLIGSGFNLNMIAQLYMIVYMIIVAVTGRYAGLENERTAGMDAINDIPLSDINSNSSEPTNVQSQRNKTVKLTVVLLIVAAIIVVLCIFAFGNKNTVDRESTLDQSEETQQHVEDPGAISWTDAYNHVGEIVPIEGEVAAISNQNACYIDLGHAYPDKDRVTIVIWPEYQSEFENVINNVQVGDTVIVEGELYLYDGIVNIEATESGQITIR